MEGIEPERETAAVARERFGLRVHQSLLADAELPADHYDVVYLCEVIEHIADPVPPFAEIRRALRPGGVVYVKTGNVRSWSRAIRGPAWSYVAYQRLGHVTYYSPTTIELLCAATELQLLGVRTWGVEVPRGIRRSLLRPLARLLRRGGHMEALVQKP